MLKDFCRVVDMLNEWTGRITAWLIFPICLIVTYDVILRYLFNRPTVWAWDINIQLLGAMVALGGGYAFLYRGHVGVDVLVEGLSVRKRAMIDLITSVFFFCGIGALLWKGIAEAWFSVKTREIDFTYFAPPLYFLRVVMAAGFFLLILQGVVKFIHDLNSVISREMRRLPDDH